MTTLRPFDVAVVALADLLAYGAATVSATTFQSPSWGYAIPRECSRCHIPLNRRAIDRIATYVGRHRADLAQTSCYLSLTLKGSVIELAVVDVGYDLLAARPPSAHELRCEARVRERIRAGSAERLPAA